MSFVTDGNDPLEPVQFSVGESDSEQGIDLDVSVRGQTGNITVDSEVSGKLGVGIGNAIGGFDEDTINIVYKPSLPPNLRGQLQDQIGKVNELFPSTLPDVPATAGGVLPGPSVGGPFSRTGLAVSRQLWTGIFGQYIAGESPVEHREVIEFQPAVVPVLPDSIEGFDTGFSVSDLPPISFKVEAKPTEFFQNAFGGLTGQIPTVYMDIPAAAFVQPIDISEFSCSELYPGIQSEVSDFRQSFSSVGGGVQESINSIEEAKEELLTLSEEYGEGVQLGEINPRRLILAGRENLIEIRNRVERISIPSEDQINNFESELESLRQNAQDVNYPRCRENFLGVLSDVEGGLEVPVEDVLEAAEDKRQILEVLNRLPDGPPDLGIQDCIDRYPDIASDFRSVRADLENTQRGSLQDLRGLVSDLAAVRRDMKGEVPDESDCFQEFQDAFDSLEEAINNKKVAGDLPQWVPECVGDSSLAARHIKATVEEARPVISPTDPITPDDISAAISSVEATVDYFAQVDPANNDISLSCNDRLISGLRRFRNRLEDIDPDVSEIDFGLGFPDCIQNDEVLSDMVSNEQERVNSLLSGDTTPEPGDVREVVSEWQDIIEYINNTNADQTAMSEGCLEDALDAATSVETELNNLLGDVGLGCSDVPRRVRNNVAGFEASVDSFTSRRTRDRSGEMKQELINDGSNLITLVRSEVSNENPCKQELLSRIRDSLASVRDISIGGDGEIPCQAQFTDANSAVSSFEQEVVTLQRPVSASRVSSLITQGEEVISQVESGVPADSPCRGEMLGRVRAAMQSLDDFTTERSLRLDIPEEADEAGQQVQQLRSRLQSVTNQLD